MRVELKNTEYGRNNSSENEAKQKAGKYRPGNRGPRNLERERRGWSRSPKLSVSGLPLLIGGEGIRRTGGSENSEREGFIGKEGP